MLMRPGRSAFSCDTAVKNASRRALLIFQKRPLQSLRQVKSLTHIPPALQAGFSAPTLITVGHGASDALLDLLRILRQRAAARIWLRGPASSCAAA